MTADKRTVSTDALETLGMIHTRDEKRDAIHLAVIPVEAARPIKPGQNIGINRDGKADYVGTDFLGIADPFIKASMISEGERFWLVIYPRVITSLRHVWTHPAIPDEAGTPANTSITHEEAVQWLTDYAAVMGVEFDELIDALESYGTFNGQPDYYDRNPQDCRPYYEIATGKPWTLGAQNYFSCSC
jgi:hypothetical protein